MAYPLIKPLPLVFGIVASMVDELTVITKSRALTSSEARQVAAVGRLADALRAAARRENAAVEFAAGFAPLLSLFAEADAASREGGLAVPSQAIRHPFPITPAALAGLAISSIVDCLIMITQNALVSPTAWRRLAQIEAMIELQAALADLAETGPGGPAAARVEDLFVVAREIIGDDLPGIVEEAATLATAAASETRN